jgi:predicted phosphohydrolase
MKRIVWSTDLHLNFVEQPTLDEFIGRLADASPDVLILSGDIADSGTIADYLTQLDDQLECPICFVMGNHDYYLGSIHQVRQQIRQLCASREKLIYLSETSFVEISDEVAIMGHDGWADARIGSYETSMVMMNDYRLIDEFAGIGKRERWAILKSLGDEAAAMIRQELPRAMERFPNVFCVTHVPPLRAACWYNGRISDDEWAPHFTCKAVGDALLEIARQHPRCELTVVCGHTHSSGTCQPLPNMQIVTGGAEYGFPAINQVFLV